MQLDDGGVKTLVLMDIFEELSESVLNLTFCCPPLCYHLSIVGVDWIWKECGVPGGSNWIS